MQNDSYGKIIYLHVPEQLIEILDLVPRCRLVHRAQSNAGALNHAAVEWQTERLGVGIDGMVPDRLIHVTVQLICRTTQICKQHFGATQM